MMRLVPIRCSLPVAAAACVGLLLGLPVAAQQQTRPALPRSGAIAVFQAPRVSTEKQGELPTRDGQRLRLVTDVGAVRVFTRNAGQISYRVRVETDASQPDARQIIERFVVTARGDSDGVSVTAHASSREIRDRLWVSFEINVPRNFQIDVRTDAGNLAAEDLDGNLTFVTAGGDLTAGRVAGSARLETQGGHIRVQNVEGNLVATTLGGHVLVGQVRGDATLRSGGGNVRVDSVGGVVNLESGGGSISILKTATRVNAVTAGGRIDVGESQGSIRARTGGGPIRVARVVGPTEFEAAGGSIYLTRVEGQVRATTSSGTITAWITPDGKLVGGSQLLCGQGDIEVYLPRELAITIDAVIESVTDQSIVADPELPLKISYETPAQGQRVLRAAGNLNGGGQVLRLRTTGGNIRLRYSDAFLVLNEKLYQEQMEQTRRRIEMQQRLFQEMGVEQARRMAQVQKNVEAVQRATERARAEAERQRFGFWEELQRRFSQAWFGQVRVESQEQDAKRLNNVLPRYPEAAKRAGVQGTVRLLITIGKDGAVTNTRVLSGHPLLAEAAVDAVRLWRYAPTLSDGQPVAVVTIVGVEFRLN